MAGNHVQLARGLAAGKKGGVQHLGYSAAGTISATVSVQCIAVMVLATTECMIDINRTGTTVTSATGHVLPANESQVFVVKGGKDLVTAAMYSVQGRIHITELVAPGLPENN